MTQKSTYWLTGPDEHFVQAEGAERRDELTATGWAEAGEPGHNDRVWLRHDVTGAYALFGAAALDAWQARGWQHAAPPTERTEQGPVVVLPEPTTERPAIPESSVITTSPAEKPKTETEKEKNRA